VQIGLKTIISISDRKHSRRLAAVEADELQKDGKKSRKTMKNISINLYYTNFFIVIKKQKIAKNWQEFLHQLKICIF